LFGLDDERCVTIARIAWTAVIAATEGAADHTDAGESQ
jgi:hypothetical protein